MVGVQALCKQSENEPSRVGLPFCTEHNSRTCCTKSTALQIYSRLQKPMSESLILHHNSSLSYFPHSKLCLHTTESVFCSPCDGDMGEDRISGICPALCDAWFQACAEDLFQPGITSPSIELCYSKSLICSPLKSILSSPKDFCTKMGYTVKPDSCYSGTPAALLRGPARESPAVSPIPLPVSGYYLVAVVSVVSVAVFVFMLRKTPTIKNDMMRVRLARLERLEKQPTEEGEEDVD